MAVVNYTKTGNKTTTTVTLNKTIFGVEASHELLKSTYLAYLANGRVNLARTKTKGEVRGGGRKPWRQKGTGNARTGSIRNPIWEGGGIIFGPTGEENYSHKIHKTAKRNAIRQALSLSVKDNKLIIIEDIALKEPKTQEIIGLLKKLDVKKNVLLVVSNKTEDLKRATNNLKTIKLVQANYLNVFDLLNADTVVVTKPSLDMINEWLGVK